jgi:hypothetical protein
VRAVGHQSLDRGNSVGQSVGALIGVGQQQHGFGVIRPVVEK